MTMSMKKFAISPLLVVALSGCPDKPNAQKTENVAVPVQGKQPMPKSKLAQTDRPENIPVANKQRQPKPDSNLARKSYLWGSEGQNKIPPHPVGDNEHVLIDDSDTQIDIRIYVKLSKKVPDCFAVTSSGAITISVIERILSKENPAYGLKDHSRPRLFDYPFNHVPKSRLDRLCNDTGRVYGKERIINADRLHR